VSRGLAAEFSLIDRDSDRSRAKHARVLVLGSSVSESAPATQMRRADWSLLSPSLCDTTRI
jgi:hypothetical protein